jgi:hypothetical protein
LKILCPQCKRALADLFPDPESDAVDGTDLSFLSIPISNLTTAGAAFDVRGFKRKHDEESEEAQVRRRLTQFIMHAPSSLEDPNFKTHAADLVYLNHFLSSIQFPSPYRRDLENSGMIVNSPLLSKHKISYNTYHRSLPTAHI